MSGFGKPITGNIQFLHMDVLIPDDTEVETDHLLQYRTSQVPSVEGPERSCLGSVDRTPGIFILCIFFLHKRRDGYSSLLTGLYMPFMSVNHPIFGD